MTETAQSNPFRKALWFRQDGRILSMWPEKTIEDDYVVGWCPELDDNIVVHPNNILPQVEGM